MAKITTVIVTAVPLAKTQTAQLATEASPNCTVPAKADADPRRQSAADRPQNEQGGTGRCAEPAAEPVAERPRRQPDGQARAEDIVNGISGVKHVQHNLRVRGQESVTATEATAGGTGATAAARGGATRRRT